MGLSAMALLKLEPDQVFDELTESSEDVGARVGRDGRPYQIRRLSDAILLPLSCSLADPPEAVLRATRAALGDLLDRHDDPQGFVVFPASYEPDATHYEQLVGEIGEAGERIAIRPSGPVDMASLQGLVETLSTQLGPELSALNPEDAANALPAMMEMMGKLAESGALNGIMGQVKELAESGALPAPPLDEMGNIDPDKAMQQAAALLGGEAASTETEDDSE